MFEDEAGFGRINKPKRCWAPKGVRPCIPSHHIREYRYAYGAVEPLTGDSFFLVLPWSNTVCMNVFLDELSKTFPEEMIMLALDQASWHTTNKLVIPDNIQLFYLLPCTPEMNPVEQVWKEMRKRGFKNESFATLEKVVDKVCNVINSFSVSDIVSITGREWIMSIV
jgi:putative transposase